MNPFLKAVNKTRLPFVNEFNFTKQKDRIYSFIFNEHSIDSTFSFIPNIQNILREISNNKPRLRRFLKKPIKKQPLSLDKLNDPEKISRYIFFGGSFSSLVDLFKKDPQIEYLHLLIKAYTTSLEYYTKGWIARQHHPDNAFCNLLKFLITHSSSENDLFIHFIKFQIVDQQSQSFIKTIQLLKERFPKELWLSKIFETPILHEEKILNTEIIHQRCTLIELAYLYGDESIINSLLSLIPDKFYLSILTKQMTWSFYNNTSRFYENKMMGSLLHLSCIIGKSQSFDKIFHSLPHEQAYLLLKQQNNNGYFPIHLTCLYNNINALSSILSIAKAKKETLTLLNLKDPDNNTVLQLACLKGHHQIVKYILTQLNDQQQAQALTKKNDFFQTALHLACVSGDKETVKIVCSALNRTIESCEQKANLFFQKDLEDNTPIHFICKYGNEEVLKIFVNAALKNLKTDKEKQKIFLIENKYQETPLQLCYTYDRLKIFKSLILFLNIIENTQTKIDILTSQNRYSSTPIDLIKHCKSPEVLQAAFHLFASMFSDMDNPFQEIEALLQIPQHSLLFYVIQNHFELIGLTIDLLKKTDDDHLRKQIIFYKISSNQTIFHLLYKRKAPNKIKPILNLLDEKDKFSLLNPLPILSPFATTINKINYMQTLDLVLDEIKTVQYKIKLLFQNFYFFQKPPLHFVIEQNSQQTFFKIINLLKEVDLKQRIKMLSLQDSSGNTPFHTASKNSDPKYLTTLLNLVPKEKNKKALLAEENNFNKNTLHIAYQKGNFNVIKTIFNFLKETKWKVLLLKKEDYNHHTPIQTLGASIDEKTLEKIIQLTFTIPQNDQDKVSIIFSPKKNFLSSPFLLNILEKKKFKIFDLIFRFLQKIDKNFLINFFQLKTNLLDDSFLHYMIKENLHEPLNHFCTFIKSLNNKTLTNEIINFSYNILDETPLQFAFDYGTSQTIKTIFSLFESDQEKLNLFYQKTQISNPFYQSDTITNSLFYQAISKYNHHVVNAFCDIIVSIQDKTLITKMFFQKNFGKTILQKIINTYPDDIINSCIEKLPVDLIIKIIFIKNENETTLLHTIEQLQHKKSFNTLREFYEKWSFSSQLKKFHYFKHKKLSSRHFDSDFLAENPYLLLNPIFPNEPDANPLIVAFALNSSKLAKKLFVELKSAKFDSYLKQFISLYPNKNIDIFLNAKYDIVSDHLQKTSLIKTIPECKPPRIEEAQVEGLDILQYFFDEAFIKQKTKNNKHLFFKNNNNKKLSLYDLKKGIQDFISITNEKAEEGDPLYQKVRLQLYHVIHQVLKSNQNDEKAEVAFECAIAGTHCFAAKQHLGEFLYNLKVRKTKTYDIKAQIENKLIQFATGICEQIVHEKFDTNVHSLNSFLWHLKISPFKDEDLSKEDVDTLFYQAYTPKEIIHFIYQEIYSQNFAINRNLIHLWLLQSMPTDWTPSESTMQTLGLEGIKLNQGQKRHLYLLEENLIDQKGKITKLAIANLLKAFNILKDYSPSPQLFLSS